MEGICRFLQRTGGTTGGVYNPGVVVSAMDEANLQGMIYYIKHFKRIWRTCTHADVELDKVNGMYHHGDTEEDHNYTEVVPTVDRKDWTNTLETVEGYIRGFRGEDGQPLSYGLRDFLIAPVTASDPTYRANGSKYFTHDKKIITLGLIRSEPAAFGSDPEVFGPFTDSFITDRALIWENMIAIFQVLYAWTYLKSSKKHRDGMMGYKLI